MSKPCYRQNLSLLLCLLATSACGNLHESADDLHVTEASTACQARSAEILVGDANLIRLCGCAESANATIAAGTRLDCTVSAGTTVFFIYAGATLRHQIAPSSGTYGASFIYDGTTEEGRKIPVHSVIFPAAGSFDFADQFQPMLRARVTAI